MVGAETALEIRVLHRHGKGVREMGLSRNAVRRYLRDEDAVRYKARRPRATKLDPFKGYVTRRLAAAAPERIPASVLLVELRGRGYAGGVKRLKVFIASQRPSMEPGQQMQVDWATIRRRAADRRSVFVTTLGWTRAAYAECVTDERRVAPGE